MPVEAVIFLLVDVQPCLVVVWRCGEGYLEGWVETSYESLCADEVGEEMDDMWIFLGYKEDYLPAWDGEIFLYQPGTVFPKVLDVIPT